MVQSNIEIDYKVTQNGFESREIMLKCVIKSFTCHDIAFCGLRSPGMCQEGHHFVFCFIPRLSCLSYVVAHDFVCYFHFPLVFNVSAQYDLSCGWALKHHSFNHSRNVLLP